MRRKLAFACVCIGSCFLGCSGTDKAGIAAPDSNAPYPHGSDGTLPAAADDAGTSSLGFDPQSPFGGFFRYGVNGGYPNPNFDDQALAALEQRRGCNSQRISLPETHLARWGWEIEVADLTADQSLGLSGQVGFLTSPTREHSSAPATAQDWELAQYIPRNLYEPILGDDGQVNPDNYWAAYVYKTVSTYKSFIKIWEIWNEPDWVADWQLVDQWKTRAPTAADLPRFNGSIFDYVRMLRVSKLAAQLADPQAKIATGGLGYPNFLAALLRSTDNPLDGSVTSKFPKTGAAYIDVLSFHHYPIYTQGNSDAALGGYFDQIEAFRSTLAQSDASIVAWETTETGAPHAKVGNNPGGEDYARNYLLKVMINAQTYGIDGIDWFDLADSATSTTTDDPYALMGLYQPVANLTSIDAAVATTTGAAYATLGKLLGKARFDDSATHALGLPANVKGAAFSTSDGKRALALWATTNTGESATATLPNTTAWTAYEWDWSSTGATVSIAAGDVLALESTPRIFIER